MEKPRFTNGYRNSNIEHPIDADMFPIKKQIALFTIGWFGLNVLATLIQFILVGANKIIGNSDTYNLSILTNTIGYIALCVILVLVANKDLVKLTPSFKKVKPYIAGLICFGAIFAFNVLYGNLINLLGIKATSNANQEALDNAAAKYTMTSIVLFGIIAPICEELTYRVGLFSLCKRRSNVFAYIVSTLIFAFIHFNLDLSSTKAFVNELLNLPYYMFAGFIFALTYDKFGLAGSLTAHIVNNVLSFTVFTQLL